MKESCTKSVRIAESVRLRILENRITPKETYSDVISRFLDMGQAITPEESVN